MADELSAKSRNKRSISVYLACTFRASGLFPKGARTPPLSFSFRGCNRTGRPYT